MEWERRTHLDVGTEPTQSTVKVFPFSVLQAAAVHEGETCGTAYALIVITLPAVHFASL